MTNIRSLSCIFFLVSSTLLVACDKGQKTLDEAEANYKSAVNKPLTEANLVEAHRLTVIYRVVSQAYADKSSGKSALDKLDQMKERANTRLEELGKEIDKINAASLPALNKYLQLAAPLEKKTRAHKSSFSNLNPIVEGTCLADVQGSEFDKVEDRLMAIRIYQVKKTGNEEVLVKKILISSKADMIEVGNAIEKIGKEEAIEKYIANEMLRIECSRGLEVGRAYLEFLEKYKPIELLRNQTLTLAMIKSGGMLR